MGIERTTRSDQAEPKRRHEGITEEADATLFCLNATPNQPSLLVDSFSKSWMLAGTAPRASIRVKA